MKLKIGDFVYLKTDIDQYKRMVTGYTVRDNSENVVYLLSFGEEETSHYECEISLEEDIILKSPFRIPPKGLQDLRYMKGITTSEIAYYDICLTESQTITSKDNVIITLFGAAGLSESELATRMGTIENI